MTGVEIYRKVGCVQTIFFDIRGYIEVSMFGVTKTLLLLSMQVCKHLYSLTF